MRLGQLLKEMELYSAESRLSAIKTNEQVLIEGQDEKYYDIKEIFFLSGSRTILRIGEGVWIPPQRNSKWDSVNPEYCGVCGEKFINGQLVSYINESFVHAMEYCLRKEGDT